MKIILTIFVTLFQIYTLVIGQCDVCGKSSIACVNATSYKICLNGEIYSDDTYNCPSNYACKYDNLARCVKGFKSSSCPRFCGSCNPQTNTGCKDHQTFIFCINNKPLMFAKCPSGLVCDSTTPSSCVDPQEISPTCPLPSSLPTTTSSPITVTEPTEEVTDPISTTTVENEETTTTTEIPTTTEIVTEPISTTTEENQDSTSTTTEQVTEPNSTTEENEGTSTSIEISTTESTTTTEISTSTTTEENDDSTTTTTTEEETKPTSPTTESNEESTSTTESSTTSQEATDQTSTTGEENSESTIPTEITTTTEEVTDPILTTTENNEVSNSTTEISTTTEEVTESDSTPTEEVTHSVPITTNEITDSTITSSTSISTVATSPPNTATAFCQRIQYIGKFSKPNSCRRYYVCKKEKDKFVGTEYICPLFLSFDCRLRICSIICNNSCGN